MKAMGLRFPLPGGEGLDETSVSGLMTRTQSGMISPPPDSPPRSDFANQDVKMHPNDRAWLSRTRQTQLHPRCCGTSLCHPKTAKALHRPRKREPGRVRI